MIVYAGGPQNVDTVVIGGDVVLDNGRCTRVDEAALIQELQERSLAVSRRAATDRFLKSRRFTPYRDYERIGHRKAVYGSATAACGRAAGVSRKAVSDLASRVPFAWEDRLPWLELDFPIAEFEARVARLQQALEADGLDALILYGGQVSENNIRYVSGFWSFWGDSLVLVARTGAPILLTNAIFHGEPMHSNIQTTWLRDVRPVLNRHSTATPVSLVDLARGRAQRLGRPAGAARHRRHARRPRPHRPRAAAEARRLRVRRHVRHHPPHARHQERRRDRDDAEARRGHHGRHGRRSRRRAAGCERERDRGGRPRRVHGGGHGADDPVRCMAIAGQRSFMKNVWPRTDRFVHEDELVVIDIGGRLGGYQTDMSRNIVAGTPSGEVERMLEACLEAQEAGLAATRPGVTVSSMLNAMKRVIADHGFSEWDWTTGHGAGMDFLEEPYFGADSEVLFEPGMTFYIEPMIVPTHIGTICIEDIVLVTEDGCEELTSSVKRTW